MLQKYALLGNSCHFVPIAIETSGVFGPEALSFLRELGRRIKGTTVAAVPAPGNRCGSAEGNTAAVLGTAPPTDIVYI